ncbi:DUF4342 domain-containing protein [Amycolatopsis sp. NPDC021455]|uniref:DUF4342 domain-containing protein n=1 Tax=Amycolatopsis sp. NPDC021455 TaxID=3154901 RepID=UPI0033E7B3AB
MTVDSPATRKAEKFRGQELVARVKELIHQGNVRRIRVKNDEGHPVLEIPVTAGVVAAIAAPVVTAIGAIAALAKDWTIEVDHTVTPPREPAAEKKPEEAAGE